MTARSAAPSLVSLFAGAGGMDVGLERAGWHTEVATDIDLDCLATLAASQAARVSVTDQAGRVHLEGAGLLTADIRELRAADLRPAGASRSWRPALLAGGAPCQPWSSAGLQRGLSDERGLLIYQMVRLTDELQPDFVLFENVRGLVTAVGPKARPGEVLEWIKTSFEELGYATTFATLNAADYGAAQRRVRLFMLASRAHRLPGFPAPSHHRQAEADLLGARKAWLSLGEFLDGSPDPDPGDIVRPTSRRRPELAALKTGTGLRTGGRVENNRPGGHWGYRQDCFVADPELPSRTILAATTPDWFRLPDGSHRRLTWLECAALQGFPTQWSFQGTTTSRFRQIGNAVQADVVEVLGRALLESFAEGPTKEAPASRPLPAEFARRVKYTVAEHRTNGEHRVRVRTSVA